MTARSSFVGLALLLAACAGTPKQVVSVAKSDLGCDQVEISDLGDDRYAASGCGRGGVYTELCGPGGCQWVRLGSATDSTAGGYGQQSAPPVQPAPPREIIAAPPPPQREVIAAPPPAQREIIPAPPPANADAGSTDGSTQQGYTPQPTPLSQGELSEPYQADVPVQPVVQRVEVPPPAPLIEERPYAPYPNYVWVSGYWWWNQPRWVWVGGYWCPPRIGYSYIAGSWYWSRGAWWYGPGGWARPGGTYIVYPIGPRPHRTTIVRDFRPHRATSVASSPYVGGGGGSFKSGPSRVGQAPMGVQSAPRVAAPSRGSFTPRDSSLYRYPTSVAAPSRGFGTPSRSPAGFSSPRAATPNSGFAAPRSGFSSSPIRSAPPRRFEGGLGSGRSGPSFSSGRVNSPAPRVAPPSGGFGRSGGSAPLRAPSRASSPVPRGSSLGR